MKRLLAIVVVVSGCVDFDAIAVDACETKGLCDDTHRSAPVDYLGYCTTCTSRAQCGGGNNRCLTVGGSASFCGLACSDDGDCEPGSSCTPVPFSDGGVQRNCVPSLPMQCDGGVRTTSDAGVRRDGGSVDAGAADAGARDAGVVDAGAADAGSVDAGSADGG